MADHARRPLLTANSGQFIGSPARVEVSLAKLLQSATRWGALVLLDEADVFMQARNLQDLERNGIVSMLLRTLEYFEGTLFLTTNRVGTIDSAFMSRIHLALSYEPLSETARRQLWDTWITRACRGQRPVWVKEELLVQLSVLNVSGRDIKNISLLAQGLAKTGQRDMASEDIWKGVNAMTQFQEDFRVSVTHEEAGKRSDPKVPNSKPMPSRSWLEALCQWWWSQK
ncbi:ATPase [Colletotrichum nymphaeae SA-01]|uniref:ATPase n=1 Tax=Colletotrichum nymphaeae SA-01 TaxID=1460502 RepID=A0A135SRB7_9PEZI|nr:ATPase [Colletotrichum nymphaeae SA-01]